MSITANHLPNTQPWPPRTWLPNLFGFRASVNQRHYAGFGFGLMLLKYLVEAIFIATLTGQLYTPLDFVNPLVTSRERFTAEAPLWLGMGWVLWTLPFLWIAVSMSIRRAAFVGYSPWLGLLVLVPVVNLITMLVLAAMPDPGPLADKELEQAKQIAELYRPPETASTIPFRRMDPRATSGVVAALLGLAGGAGFLVLMVVCSVYLFESYGAVMFFGTPIVTGALASYCLNTPVPRTLAATLGHSVLTLTIACAAFLLFGLEGAICILMAIPIMVPLGLLGAFVGYAIAVGLRRPGQSEFSGLVGSVILLPLFGAAEAKLQPVPTFVVLTTTEIAATPEQVWEHVVQFSDITETPEWYFHIHRTTCATRNSARNVSTSSRRPGKSSCPLCPEISTDEVFPNGQGWHRKLSCRKAADFARL